MKTLKQKIEVMTAAANGAKIEYISPSDPHDYWSRCYLANEDDYHWDWSVFDYRVAEPAIAPGHNPDKLTPEQVETHLGWRLLELDEIKKRKWRYTEIEAWIRCTNLWNADKYEGSCDENIYRTKLTRGQLAALDRPAPKKRLPLGPEDFPPGTVLRYKNRNHMWQSVTAVNSTGVRGAIDWEDFTAILDEERSLDGGKTWLPCYREQ